MKDNKPVQVELDTTGEFLSTTTKFNHQQEEERIKKERDLLTHNLHLLYEHRKEILSNPKMFFTPVSVGHNLAYSGRSGFENPTLGIVLEWLERCPYAKDIDANGEVALLYWLAGSPLSGCNKCSFISKDGTTSTHPIRVARGFWCSWRAFMRINRKYAEQKKTAEAYTLEEVINLFEK